MLQLSEKSLREMMEGHLRQLQHQIATVEEYRETKYSADLWFARQNIQSMLNKTEQALLMLYGWQKLDNEAFDYPHLILEPIDLSGTKLCMMLDELTIHHSHIRMAFLQAEYTVLKSRSITDGYIVVSEEDLSIAKEKVTEYSQKIFGKKEGMFRSQSLPAGITSMLMENKHFKK